MTKPLITRAAYLHIYLDLSREIGIPVERRLTNSRLPGLIDEQPDAYVSLPLALDWVAHTGRDLSPMELGFFASGGLSLDSFDGSLRAAVLNATTGRARVERFFRLHAVEDNSAIPRICWEGDHVRRIIGNSSLDKHPNACLAQWLNIRVVIAIIQSFAGAGWSPVEVTYVSSLPAPEASLDAFRNTKVLTGQRSTSVLVEADVFARRCPEIATLEAGRDDGLPNCEGATGWTFRTALRNLIQPYIAEGRIDLGMAAELLDISPRTLQRRLRLCGTSFSEMVQETRFHLAHAMLSDTSEMVRDVAMMSGYENPQHFSRAFRRMTGLTPSKYRRLSTQEATLHPPQTWRQRP